MNFPLRIVFFGFLLLLGVSVHAQDPYFTSINKLSGLPSNSIYDLFQDSKGFIWIANNEGLTRYDGFEFKTYVRAGQTSRSGNQIEEDKYGRIWYKNFDGYLYYVEHDSLKSLKQNAPGGKAEYAIIDDRLLVFQNHGIDILDLAILKVIDSVAFVPDDMVSQLHYKDSYFISVKDFLYKITADGTVVKRIIGKEGLLAGSRNGVVVMDIKMAEKGLYEVVGTEVYKRGISPEINYAQGIAYCNNIHWVFTPNGVWAYDETGKDINNGKPFFPSQSISSILRDRDGNYWFGTLNDGILFVPDIHTRLFATAGFAPNILMAVKNKVYIGTKDNSIYTYDIFASRFELKFKEDIRHEIICFLADTLNSKFSFSSYNFYITDTTFRSAKGTINSIKDLVTMDGKYYAFASTGLIGLIKVRDDIPSDYDSIYNASTVPNMENTARLVGSCRGRAVAYSALHGTVYGGTSKGLFIISPKTIVELKLNGETIYTKKLISYRSKVYVLTPQNQVLEINERNEIRSMSLAVAHELYINIRKAGSSLYLLTKSGIRILDTLTGNVKILNFRPGIKTEEINDLEIVGDRMIFSTERGLIVISDSPSSAGIAPNMVVNSISVNGVKAPGDDEMEFSHEENDIEISYSILSFSTGRYELFYKINDGKWQSNSGITRTLKLASLSPGRYSISFRLKAVDSDRFFPQKAVTFTINKPFWTEWWFVVLGFVVLSAGGVAYYKWQTGLLKKQNLLAVEKVELERNLRNSMLTSIRSQMNPHFFYNALNAIQSFIFSDDKRNASTYLVKLSKLTRMILEMSEKESISLDQEAEALKLYLELEQMRFSNDFNYELLIGKNVETELLKIPPMIVQPYVENAIKHGLLHKKGNKYLSIAIERIADDLRITIDDNGVGRDKANELNQVKKEKHRSFSTDANSKRIEFLNKGRSKNIGVVYIDKKDEQGVPSGTTVIILIPII